MDEPEATPSTLTALALAHPALAASFIGGGIVSLRLLFLAHGNLTTAIATVQSANTAQIIVATLVAAMSWIPAMIFADQIIRWSSRSGTRWRGRSAPWLIVSGMLTLTVTPLGAALMVSAGILSGELIGGPVLTRVARKAHKPPGPGPARNALRGHALQTARGWLLAVLSVILFIFTALQVAWWPVEIVDIAGHRKPVVGYVVDQGSTFTTILEDHDRRLIRVPTDDIKHRTVCDQNDPPWLARSIAHLILFDPPDYPQCP